LARAVLDSLGRFAIALASGREAPLHWLAVSLAPLRREERG